MEPARRAARRLVNAGRLEIVQRGRVVDPWGSEDVAARRRRSLRRRAAVEFVAPPVASYQQRPFLACPGGQKCPGGA